jgi:hypothetical protein
MNDRNLNERKAAYFEHLCVLAQNSFTTFKAQDFITLLPEGSQELKTTMWATSNLHLDFLLSCQAHSKLPLLLPLPLCQDKSMLSPSEYMPPPLSTISSLCKAPRNQNRHQPHLGCFQLLQLISTEEMWASDAHACFNCCCSGADLLKQSSGQMLILEVQYVSILKRCQAV